MEDEEAVIPSECNTNVISEEQVTDDIALLGQTDSIIFIIDESEAVTTNDPYVGETDNSGEHHPETCHSEEVTTNDPYVGETDNSGEHHPETCHSEEPKTNISKAQEQVAEELNECSNDSGKLVMVDNEFCQTDEKDIRSEETVNIKSTDISSQNSDVPIERSNMKEIDVQQPGPSKSTDDTVTDKVDPDISEEEAHNILMKALEKIGPKIGKDFVLMFKDPSTSEVKEIASDTGKKFLKSNTDVVKKFSSICSDKESGMDEEPIKKQNGDTSSDNDDEDDDVISNSGMDEEEAQKKVESKTTKRAPRTSVMMKKLAKLDKKERLKNAPSYSCDYCPSKYGTFGNLNKHLKNKHEKGVTLKRGPKVKDDSLISEISVLENSELHEKTLQPSSKDEIMKIKDFGEFESVVTTLEESSTPGKPQVESIASDNTLVNTEKKRGRGRPPKDKSNVKDSTNENITPRSFSEPSKVLTGKKSNQRPVGRPRKEPNSEKQIKVDTNTPKRLANRRKISDEDYDCFLDRHEDETSKINLECKLCLLKFSSNRMARDHLIQEHMENLEQCTRTLDLFPDSNKSSKFDKYIYTINDDVKDGFIPSELFNTPGRGGRKRTPSKKLLESQAALSKITYVCKICHRRFNNKNNILQHMAKNHSSVLPPELKENDDEENIEAEEEEEEMEEDSEDETMESDLEFDEEEQDYQPSKKVTGESVKTSPRKGVKRKNQTEEPTQKKIKTEQKDDKTFDLNEVHVKVEVIPEEEQQKNQTIVSDEKSGEDEEIQQFNQTDTEFEGDVKKESLTVKRRRSRVKPSKKIPSYYVYCDHEDTEIIKKTPQELPFCTLCERYKCQKCTLTFKHSSHINRHIRIIHNKEKKYKCAQCDAKFTTNESLEYHKKWHTGVKDVECPHCDMKFLVYKNLRKHMVKHHPGQLPIRKKKTNHCKICQSVFTRKERLEYHMLEKHPANNPEKECRICGQKFDTEEQCYNHSDAHSDMKKVPVAKCPHCPLYCSSKNNLKRHVDRVHLNIRKYLCTECGKRFKGRDAFIYHMKRHKDLDGRDFECHICQKKIATDKGLEIHLRTHTGLKPYVCETCGRGFSQKGNMLSHQAIHFEERPFECEDCHKTFKKKFDLYKHMKRHRIQKVAQTGDMSYLEGAGKIYECPLEDCKLLFCSTNDLKLHMRKHNNERPFNCTICNKDFAVKSRLVRHLRNVHSLRIPDCDLSVMESDEFAEKVDYARSTYRDKKSKFQTVMIPQPSGEQIEVQIMTEDTEGVEDLLALANPTTFSTDKPKEEAKNDEDENEEIHFKIETTEDEGSNVQIINLREDNTGEVQIHTDDDNIVLDPAIIQTLLNSGQQTIYYYVDQ